MFHRQLNILKSNSFFLFGARGTGKTSLLSTLFSDKEALRIDLLDQDQLSRLQDRPEGLVELIQRAEKQWCLIDEVQKVPELLDVVHRLIEKDKLKFALTGSSARKLKRGGASLLAGRAYTSHLFPLTFPEIGNHFELDQVLSWGSLPKIFD